MISREQLSTWQKLEDIDLKLCDVHRRNTKLGWFSQTWMYLSFSAVTWMEAALFRSLFCRLDKWNFRRVHFSQSLPSPKIFHPSHRQAKESPEGFLWQFSLLLVCPRLAAKLLLPIRGVATKMLLLFHFCTNPMVFCMVWRARVNSSVVISKKKNPNNFETFVVAFFPKKKKRNNVWKPCCSATFFSWNLDWQTGINCDSPQN